MNLRLTLIALVWLIASSLDAKELTLGDKVPEYLGIDMSGDGINISDQNGKLVVVYFWASHCKKCIADLPVLQNIQTKIGGQLIKVVAVNYKQPRKVFKQLMQEMTSFDISLTHDKKGQIAKKFGVDGIPHLFIIGKDGSLVYQRKKYKKLPIQQVVNILKRELTND